MGGTVFVGTAFQESETTRGRRFSNFTSAPSVEQARKEALMAKGHNIVAGGKSQTHIDGMIVHGDDIVVVADHRGGGNVHGKIEDEETTQQSLSSP